MKIRTGIYWGGDTLTFSALVDSVQGVPVVKVRGEIDLATIDKLLTSYWRP